MQRVVCVCVCACVSLNVEQKCFSFAFHISYDATILQQQMQIAQQRIALQIIESKLVSSGESHKSNNLVATAATSELEALLPNSNSQCIYLCCNVASNMWLLLLQQKRIIFRTVCAAVVVATAIGCHRLPQFQVYDVTRTSSRTAWHSTRFGAMRSGV